MLSFGDGKRILEIINGIRAIAGVKFLEDATVWHHQFFFLVLLSFFFVTLPKISENFGLPRKDGVRKKHVTQLILRKKFGHAPQ
jgi:hypothetical protein